MKTVLRTLFLTCWLFLAGDLHGQTNKYIDPNLPQLTARVFAPGVVSTSRGNGCYEEKVAFSPDFTECYFDVINYANGSITSYSMRHTNGVWTTPAVAFYKQLYNGASAALTGDKLFFLGLNPTNSAYKGIFKVVRTPEGWSAPTYIPVDPRPFYLSVARSETLYFLSLRDGGHGVYRSRLVDGQYGPAERIEALQTVTYLFDDFYVSPDESYIIIYTRLPDTFGQGDLYVSYQKQDGTWTNPLHLGREVNTSGYDYAPSISPDGKYIFWTRDTGGEGDIYWISAEIAKLYKPTFTRITAGPIVSGANTGAGAWGDFNNDGWQDLYATATPGSGFTASSFLFLNNGDGTSIWVTNSPLAEPMGASWSCAWGDYDNDGWLDLVKGVEQGNTQLYHNLGDGSFSNVTSVTIGSIESGVRSAVWGDYDSDGNLDILLASVSPGAPGQLLHNEGSGAFQPAAGLSLNPGDCCNASWADYDNDGRLDLFVARSRFTATNGSNMLFHNEGDGTFLAMTNSPVANGPDGSSACWGDYDNDGYLDLFVSRTTNRCLLYHNSGNGTSTQVTNGALVTTVTRCAGAAWADYDNDGYLDLFIANSLSTNLLYHNNGDGTFSGVYTGGIVRDVTYGQAVAWGDYDNDGFPDLFVGSTNTNFLYHNNGNSNNWVTANWITIKCEGRVSNRAAIGAKVRVQATIGGREMWQMREISGGNGAGGQNDLRAQFGLGDATNVNTIRIEWPSGIIQELHDAATKQFLSVREPSRLSGALTNGEMCLRLQGGKGIVYRIESSEDLAAWSPWTVLTNSSSTTNWIVPANSPAHFFRAVED